ncbi:MAG: 3-ketoacyl-ACP reductase [Pseudomonadota bacterium]|jgi:3-oxoacyl-[acyl-carrier protein] reductase
MSTLQGTLTDLTGRIVWVTGASRGIGQSIALTCAQAGATVIGTATTELGAQSITDKLSALGLGEQAGYGIVLNVTDTTESELALNTILLKYGKIDILINNAGITRDGLAMRMKDEDWSSVLDTNLTAIFKLSRLVMRPMMKARTGRIVNISSVVSSLGNAGQANYCAAKAGLEGLSRALARELGSRNITVNCVAPGFITTDMTQALSESVVNTMQAQIPLGHFGMPQDIANAVLFLISPMGNYITGTTLHVNGGMYM